MIIVLGLLSRLLPLLGLKFRWPRHFSPRALNEVFFQGGKSLDSWTPGPKPLCHRHPTGPHPSGLWWTPAKGDSTKSNFALECQVVGRFLAIDRARAALAAGVEREVIGQPRARLEGRMAGHELGDVVAGLGARGEARQGDVRTELAALDREAAVARDRRHLLVQPVEAVVLGDQRDQRLGLLAAGELLDARHRDREARAGDVR